MGKGAKVLAVATTMAAIGTALVLVVSREPVQCSAAEPAEMSAAIDEGVAWLVRALQPDGSFRYEYHRVEDTFAEDYHPVRHVGALMALYQVAASEMESSALALATGDAALVFVLDRLVEVDDRASWRLEGRPAVLGSAALAILALLHRREATGDTSYDDLVRSFGRFMQAMLRDDGGMWARASGADLTPIAGITSTFYTGEAFWAFARLANTFPEEPWDEPARAVGHYLATARDAEEGIDNPPLADQWAAYGFSEMRDWGEVGEEEATYLRSLVDRYGQRLRIEVGREKRRVGDGSKPPDESVVQARGAGFGTTVEALGALWKASRVQSGLSDLEPRLRNDLRCGAAILVARQVDDVRAQQWVRPEYVAGAWFDEDVTRVDDQQHAISGVLAALPAATLR